MVKIYTKDELLEILDKYENPNTRDDAVETGEQLLTDFVNNNADIEQDALGEFGDIIDKIGGHPDENGNGIIYTELGAQALAKYQSIIESLENVENSTDDQRIYSLTSDQNQIKFDLISLSVYKDMGLVDASIDPANMTPNQVAETINNINLTNEQRAEYSNKFIDKIINNAELFELLPPKMLADAYTFTREQILKNPNNQNFRDRFVTLAKRIDYLIVNFAKNVDYFYSDPSNIADVYAGYHKMCDIRSKDLKANQNDNPDTKQYKIQLKQSVADTMARLDEIVALYSQMWNLKDLKPEDADELDARWKEISNKLKDVELTDELLATLAKYEFLDENGNPIPQFIDEQGNLHQDFQHGYKLNPDGRLNRIISLAKNDVTMQNVGDLSHDVEDINLTEALFDRVPWKMAEISVPDQVISGIESKPSVMMTQQDVDEFWDSLETNGGNISDRGYQAALDAQVNQAAGFAGLMADKVGPDKPIVFRPFEAVEDIDKLASTRSEKIGAGERKQKVRFFRRMLKNFGAAAVMSAGLTFIGKATGVAYAGAAVGTAIGVGNMIVQGFKWRREQKKAGKPHGLKAFFSDKRNYGPAIASGLGVAAVISMATGNPELAAGFGIGAMAVGGGTSAKMTYDDALKAGYTKGQALAGALGVVGATIAGGLVGRVAMNGVINYVNNETNSNLFKTEHTSTTERIAGTERTYNDGVIEHHEDMMLKNHWETPQSFDARIDGLMNAGLSHDDAVRYLLAWHDATDHNLGNGYFNNIGMSPDALAALRGSIDGTTIHLTPQSMAAFNHFNPHISALNQVGYIQGAPISYDLPGNAMYDSNGVIIRGNDFYTTYANGDTPYSEVPIILNDTTSVFTPNELAFPAGIGALGFYEPRVIPDGYTMRMHERAGALADRIGRRENPENEIINGPDGRGDQGSDNPGPENGPDGRENPGPNNPGPDNPGSGNTGSDNPEPENGPDGRGDGSNRQRNNQQKRRGFFSRLQQWGHNIMMNRIENKGKRRSLKQKYENKLTEDRIKAAARQKKLYDENGLTVAELDNITEKNIATAASQQTELINKISEERARLIHKLGLEDLKEKHKTQQQINRLEALGKELENFEALGGKEGLEKLKEYKEAFNDIMASEAAGQHANEIGEEKAQITKEKIKAEGKQDVKDIKKSRTLDRELKDAEERKDFERNEEIKDSLQQYNILEAKLDKLKKMNIDTPEAIELIKQISEGLNEIELGQVKNEGKKEQQRATNDAKVDKIRESGKNEAAQLWADRKGIQATGLRNVILGIFRPNKQDVEAIEKRLDIAKEKAGISKIKGFEKARRKLIRKLVKSTENHKYTEEEKEKIIDQQIDDFLQFYR